MIVHDRQVANMIEGNVLGLDVQESDGEFRAKERSSAGVIPLRGRVLVHLRYLVLDRTIPYR